MSATIDERVVRMSFDNRDFENNVQTSMSTLEKLKHSLDLSGASKGLEDVSTAARKVDMSGVSDAVDTVRVKFSAMEVAAVTALSNIVNSAFNAGKNILKSLTIDPVMTGFSEYETQINSIQTILANTSGTQAKVSQEAIQEINNVALATTDAAKDNHEIALENLKDIHEETLDSFKEAADEALDSLRKIQKQEIKAYDKTCEKTLDTLKSTQKQALKEHQSTIDAQLDAFDDAADAELAALEAKYKQESSVSGSARGSELSALTSAHKQKLALYEEEYMEKIKLIDEERYLKLKAIDDEIAALEGLTESEKEANKQAERSAKLAQLESRVNNAIGYEERIKAEAALANYKEQIAEEDKLAERKAQIEALELSKDTINKEYDAKIEEIDKEYDEKKKQENELYDLKKANISSYSSSANSAANEQYKTEKALLLKKQQEERKILAEKLNETKEALKEEQTAEQKALKEQQELEKEAILERQDEEEKALKKQQKLEKKALEEQLEAEIDALNNSHELALENIESEKSAQIRALYEVAAASDGVKATTLEDVNAALDELNAYADKTIYNFTEMTRNIGTFTAAGVDLDTSVAAIQGLANVAAVSGANSQQASTAMYQMSQALASGTIRLRDWMSLENNSMAGMGFQEQLKKTAREHGIAIDEMIAEQGTLRETLAEGWLTNDIFLETLKKYTTSGVNEYIAESTDLTTEQVTAIVNETETLDEAAKALSEHSSMTEADIKATLELARTAEDAATKVKTFTQLMDTLKESAQSGWTNTWEILIGDFEEAKALWGEASEVFGGMIGESARLRNEMLQGWKDLGGRTVLLDAIRNAFEAIGSVIKPIKEAFREIFPRTTSEQLYNMTVALRDFTSKLILSDTQSKNLKATFKGLFSILDIGKKILSAVWNAVKPLFGGMGGVLDVILGITAGIGNMITKLNDSIGKYDIFNKALQGVKNILSTVIGYFKNITNIDFSAIVDRIKSFISSVKEKFSFPGFDALKNILASIKERFADIGNSAGDMKTSVTNTFESMGDAIANSKVVKVLSGIWEAIKSIAGSIAGAMKEVVGNLSDSFEAPSLDNILKAIQGIATGGIAAALIKFINSLSKPFDELGNLGKKIGDVLDSVRDAIKAYERDLNANAMLKIAGAIAILVASIVVISMIDPVQVENSLATVSILLLELVGAMAVFSRLSGSLGGVAKISVSLVAISVALLLLVSAMEKISNLGTDELIMGFASIAALSAILVTIAKSLSKASADLIKISAGLAIFAVALNLFIPAFALLGLLPLDNVLKGALAIGSLAAILVVVSKTLSGEAGNLAKVSAALILFSAALGTLVPTFTILGFLPIEVIGKGLLALGGSLVALVGALKLLGDSNNTKGAATLIVIAAAVDALIPALVTLGQMSLPDLAKGIGAIIASLVAMVTTLKSLKGVEKGAGSLITIATALGLLVPSLVILGTLPLPTLAIGLSTIGGALAIMVKSLQEMKGTEGAGALVVIATALGLLIPSLVILGSLDIPTLAIGLSTIGGALAIMVKTLQAMKGTEGATSLIAIATALDLLIPSLVILGSLDIPTLAIGLSTIGGSLAIMVTALNAIKGGKGAASLIAISAALLLLVPSIALLGSLSLTAIGIALLSLVGIFTVLGLTALVLAPLAPVLITLAGAFAVFGVAVLALGVGVVAAGKGLLALAAGFVAIAAAGTAGATALAAAITIIITAIIGTIAAIGAALAAGIMAFLEVLTAGAPKVKDAFVAIFTSILQALGEVLPVVIDTLLKLVAGILKSLVEYLPSILESLINILEIVLEKVIVFVIDAGAMIIVKFLEGIAEHIPEVIQAGFNLLISFINGITDALNNNSAILVDSIKGLIWALINAAIEVFTGAFELIVEAAEKLFGEGVIKGIADKLTAVKDKVGEVISGAVAKVTEKITDWFDAGRKLMLEVITGISGQLRTIKSAVTTLVDKAKEAIGEKFEEWKSIGVNLIEGFIEGVVSVATKIKEAALGVIKGAVDAIRDFLGIHSPSRLFKQIGIYSDEGLILGFNAYAGKVADSAEDVGDTAVDAMSKALAGISDIVNGDMDTSPTIKPVIDLSNVEAGANRISTLFSKQQAMSISASMNDTDGYGIQNGVNSKYGTTYQFTQNNYSPKALSRVEIYRQTKNQFSAIERMATS